MEDNFKIIDLFPTPLYIKEISPNLSSIVSYLDSQEVIPTSISKKYGYRSLNTYILNESPCSDLSKYILNEVKKYGKQILSYSYEEYKFSQSWVSCKHPGESHNMHNHANSLISGVLYYGNNYSDPSSQIIFHNKSIMNHPLRPKITPPINQWSGSIYSLTPTPGTLILFPSYISHSVPKNTTNKVRKSLAFNIVPTEGFGSEEELTELKFN